MSPHLNLTRATRAHQTYPSRHGGVGALGGGSIGGWEHWGVGALGGGSIGGGSIRGWEHWGVGALGLGGSIGGGGGGGGGGGAWEHGWWAGCMRVGLGGCMWVVCVICKTFQFDYRKVEWLMTFEFITITTPVMKETINLIFIAGYLTLRIRNGRFKSFLIACQLSLPIQQ